MLGLELFDWPISLGSYQLKQVCSYFAEHTSSSGRFEIQVARHTGPLGLSSLGILAEEPMLLRARIQSRHRSATKYHIYVLVDMAKRSAESVLHYCCQCKSGLRTVGCCAHVMTVLWFLGYARHLSEIPSSCRIQRWGLYGFRIHW
jgi:hypothetical protein